MKLWKESKNDENKDEGIEGQGQERIYFSCH